MRKLLTAVLLVGLGCRRESVSMCSFERPNTDCSGRPCKSWRPCAEVKP